MYITKNVMTPSVNKLTIVLIVSITFDIKFFFFDFLFLLLKMMENNMTYSLVIEPILFIPHHLPNTHPRLSCLWWGCWKVLGLTHFPKSVFQCANIRIQALGSGLSWELSSIHVTRYLHWLAKKLAYNEEKIPQT